MPIITPAAAVAGAVSVGNVVTIGDAGWQRTFGGSVTIESDATVVYALVFGGTGGRAPVTGVSVGGQALTKVKSASGLAYTTIDVYRLASPVVGSGRPIVVSRGATGYDPVRVTFVTVRGADATNPNGTIANLDITPGTATATKTVSISSVDGGLTISAVAASSSYINGTGVSATPGYQTVLSSVEDDDGGFGVVGSAPGAASVTHSWNLRADAGGRGALLVSFSINPGSGGSTPPVVTPPPTGGGATFGNAVTLKDTGWNSPFRGTINVESDATVVYAVVFNGDGPAPVNGVSVGGQALTRIKSAERTINASLQVYRLVNPLTGAQPIAVTHSKVGYDPVQVSIFTVRGANTTITNGAVTEVEITPGSAVSTRTVTVPSSSDGLTISALVAATSYANGNGVTATPGFQTMRFAGEDADGVWGALGSAPGAASVIHSYDLRADAAGRTVYVVSFTVNGASGAPPPPPPPPPPPVLPPASAGWTTVLDYDVAQAPAKSPGNYMGWTMYERPLEKLLYSNLTLVQDPTQPGNGSPGAARVTFLPTLPGGYSPVNFQWGGVWPANTGSLDLTFTIKLSANFDNNGPRNTNGGTKLWFFATPRQNNHFIGFSSRRYDGAEGGGSGTLGGAWLEVGLQNPTLSYKTNVDLTRDVWHTVRIQIIANTYGGAKNGQLRIWVDGVQSLINAGANDKPIYTERTTVQYFSPGQTPRQDRLEMEPTYGGGLEQPPYTQWYDIGHVTAAVK